MTRQILSEIVDYVKKTYRIGDNIKIKDLQVELLARYPYLSGGTVLRRIYDMQKLEEFTKKPGEKGVLVYSNRKHDVVAVESVEGSLSDRIANFISDGCLRLSDLTDAELVSDVKKNWLNLLDDVKGMQILGAYDCVGLPFSISDLKQDNLGELMSFNVIVTKECSVETKIKKALFICEKCGEHHWVDQGLCRRVPSFCSSCKAKSKFLLDLENSEKEDYKELELCEPFGYNVSSINSSISAYVLGTKNDLRIGVEYEVTGVLEHLPLPKNNKATAIYERIFRIVGFEEKKQEEVLSEDDIDVIKEYSRDKNIFSLLSSSIAPGVVGYELIKESLLLQAVGCHSIAGMRHTMHILFIGDPGLGKTKLAKFALRIALKSSFASGLGASRPGLTVGAENTPKGYILRAGLMVLTRGGVVMLDELGKIDKDVLSSLNESMGDMVASYSKANGKAVFPADSSVLGVANPKFDRFDMVSSIPEQFNLPPAFLSRFDLVFTFKDKFDAGHDAVVADAVLGDSLSVEPEFDLCLLRKYILYCKSITPCFSDAAKDLLGTYYVSLRDKGRKENVIAITPRVIESLKRMSVASARVRLSETVSVEDAHRAIKLLEYSYSLISDDGIFDTDKLYTTMSMDDRNRRSVIFDECRELAQCNKGVVLLDSLVKSVCLKSKLCAEEIITAVEKMVVSGDLYCVGDGKYRIR